MPVNRKKTMKQIIIPTLCALMLTSCITREQADNRLARGCTAAAGIFLDEGYKIKSIKKSTFGSSKEFGNGFRVADVTAIESDGWADLDKEIECTFAEDLGVFGSSHSASLYQLKINGEIYGIQDGQLLGDIDTHLRLTAAVESALATH